MDDGDSKMDYQYCKLKFCIYLHLRGCQTIINLITNTKLLEK